MLRKRKTPMKQIKYDWKAYNIDALADDNIDKLSISMIPSKSYVLELGCATGFHTKYLKHKKHCVIVGEELDPLAAKKAKKYTKVMIVGDLNTPEIWKRIGKHKPYDVVFASSVVEHLADPWRTLDRIYDVLRPEGELVLTIPNIAFWRSRLRLLLGKWEYEDYGIFDRTHTKFFTVFSMRNALKDAGFQVIEEKYDPAGGAKWFTPLLRLFPNAYAHQVAFLAKKPQDK